jgi:hypothetical protein
VAHEVRADTASMERRQHGQRTEDLYIDQSAICIEKTAREHDMADHLPVVLGNQRKAALKCDRVPQRVDQVSHHRPVVTERLQVNIPYGLPVAPTFFAKIHARRVEAVRVARTRFWRAVLLGRGRPGVVLQ